MKTEVIATEHLVLRQEMMEDAGIFHEELGMDPEMIRYTGWNPYSTLKDAQKKIAWDLQNENACSWTITENGKVIGSIGAYDYQKEKKQIEIGYSIFHAYWNNGYAKEAVEGVCDFLLSLSEIKAILAWAAEGNTASIRVLEHNGFKNTGMEGGHLIFLREKKA